MEQSDSPFLHLAPSETASPLWLKLKAHYENRLRELRGKNDGPMPEADRHLHIGKISEVKRLLEMETPQN